MTDKPNPFEVIERHERADKSGYHVFRNAPDFYHPVQAGQAEFIFKASKVLTEFRKQWIEEHTEDAWAKGVEMDCIPVMTDGMVFGFLGVSEIDGESYDWFPAKILDD